MKIVAEHTLEIGYHTASRDYQVSSEYCGATSFLLQQEENDHPVTLGIVAEGFGADSQTLRIDHLAALVLRRHFSLSNSTNIVDLLSGALDEANQRIIARGKAYPEVAGARGVALATAVVFDRELYVANIGDCRVYLQRRGSPLIQITFDHTGPVRLGEEPATASLTPVSPNRYLGQGPEVRPDFRMRLPGEQSDRMMMEHQGAELQPGDRLLLVSSGVATALPGTHIERILKRNRPQQAARQLTRTALAHPGVQSASALVMRLPDGRASVWSGFLRTNLRYGAWLLFALVLIAGIVFGARQRSPIPTATPATTSRATDVTTPTVPVTTDQGTASPGPAASATRDYVSVYTRPPLPTDTLPAPSPTVTASPTPTATPTATATPRPTRRPPTITPSPSVTPSDTPAPPWRPSKTPTPQPTNTAPPPPTEPPTPTPIPSATPRPTLTAPRPTLTPE